MEEEKFIKLDKKWFIDSKFGNIKEEFKFLKKIGRGGYGTVYQAERKSSGNDTFLTVAGEKVAIKAI